MWGAHSSDALNVSMMRRRVRRGSGKTGERYGPSPAGVKAGCWMLDDNVERTGKELRTLLKESDVQIYTIGFGEHALGNPLRDIAEPTGGLSAFSLTDGDAEHFYARLALLLRRQYTLGFYPSDVSKKIPWRKLEVRLKTPKQMRPLKRSYQKGYPAF
jgi:hypothetical protein